MIIKQESIKNLNDNFRELAKSMMGCNYVVSLNARVFAFENNNQPFDITCLRKVYYDTVLQEERDFFNQKNYWVEGPIIKYFFDSSIEEINTGLSSLYGLDHRQHPTFSHVIQTITKHIQTFWKIVEQHFTMTHELQVLIHKPEGGSYFNDGMMWEFCFIFINNETNQGLVLSGNAFD